MGVWGDAEDARCTSAADQWRATAGDSIESFGGREAQASPVSCMVHSAGDGCAMHSLHEARQRRALHSPVERHEPQSLWWRALQGGRRWPAAAARHLLPSLYRDPCKRAQGAGKRDGEWGASMRGGVPTAPIPLYAVVDTSCVRPAHKFRLVLPQPAWPFVGRRVLSTAT